MSNPKHPREHTSWQKRVGEGALDAQIEGLKQAVAPAARTSSKAMRRVLTGSHAGPALVYKAASLYGADDKWREGFGLAGSVLGSAAGGALGAAAGGVNAPVGAVLGGVAGDEIGKDLYDDHKAFIQKNIARPTERFVAAVGRLAKDQAAASTDRALESAELNRLRINAARKWIEDRNAGLRRR